MVHLTMMSIAHIIQQGWPARQASGAALRQEP
jgi:hypothetical protein